MTDFEFLDALWELFAGDEELVSLLGIESEEDYSYKIRQANVEERGFDADKLPMVACWFMGADETFNDFVNQGYLCIDVYTEDVGVAKEIVKRIVTLIHDEFNIRVKGGGQYQSELTPIYKYRVVFKPLVFT